jgi:hypothetical protein
MKLKFHSDPGHGWVEIPFEMVASLGLKISPYSYMSAVGPNKKAYLEEDCDASILIDKLEKQGEKIQFEDIIYNDRCFIRNLPRFSV